MGQDYILRMIQQVAAMLAGIIARRQRGELAGAASEIEHRCLEHVGLPLIVIKQSTPEAVAALLATGGDRRFIRSIALAELLVQDAEISELRGNPPAAVISYNHAFRLLCDSIDVLGPDEQAHYRGKIDDIAAKLRDLSAGPGE